MISKQEVVHIAKLSRLELTEKETEDMQKNLSAILDYFAVLQGAPKVKVDKAKINLDLKNSGLRKDEVILSPASLANNLVAMAPDKKDGYFKVKAIL